LTHYLSESYRARLRQICSPAAEAVWVRGASMVQRLYQRGEIDFIEVVADKPA
jgi:hypothetical protein